MRRPMLDLTGKILHLDSPDALIAELAETARGHGLRAFNLSVRGQMRDLLLWQEEAGGPFVRTPALTTPRANPLTRIGRKRQAPFLWQLDTLSPAQTRRFGASLAALGIRAGLSLPFHHVSGYYGTLTFGAEDPARLTPAVCEGLTVTARLCMVQAISLGGGTLMAQRDEVPSLAAISPQQREILKWVAQGKTNREIGIITNTRHRTVDYHVQEILKKLRVLSRAQAAAHYMAAMGQQAPR